MIVTDSTKSKAEKASSSIQDRLLQESKISSSTEISPDSIDVGDDMDVEDIKRQAVKRPPDTSNDLLKQDTINLIDDASSILFSKLPKEDITAN